MNQKKINSLLAVVVPIIVIIIFTAYQFSLYNRYVAHKYLNEFGTEAKALILNREYSGGSKSKTHYLILQLQNIKETSMQEPIKIQVKRTIYDTYQGGEIIPVKFSTKYPKELYFIGTEVKLYHGISDYLMLLFPIFMILAGIVVYFDKSDNVN